jgi:uncharacterized phage protein gp47/JayE
MFPLATLGPTITAAGITVPTLSDIIQSLVASAQLIFGADIYLGTDSQDYQLLAILAQAQYDSNMALVAAYNSYSPQTAVGQALSNVVKINGISRENDIFSSAVVTIYGTVGTQIPAGMLTDGTNLWSLPANLTIPLAAQLTVTATCQTAGAITANPNTLTISTIILGWNTVTNLQAVPGSVVEDDGTLRQRQTISTSIPSQTSLGAITGAIANIAGVQRSAVYQNDTGAPDGNGIPGHSISVVVSGGDATEIATAIELEKNAGCGTYGTTTETVLDPEGLPIDIHFFELEEIPIYVVVTITPLAGYVGSTAAAIQAAVANFINSLAIGEDVYQAWLAAEAGLANTGLQQTFVITSLTLGTAPAPGGTGDIVIAFNAAAQCVAANVTVNA